MFCPNCGQQQNTQNLRFCSKCGLPLADIKGLVQQGGILPRTEIEEPGYKRLFTKLYGALFGLLWFIFFTLLLTSVAAILDLGELPALLAVVGVFGSMTIVLFSLILLPTSRKPKEQFIPPPMPHHYIGSPPLNSQAALPAQPASDYIPANKQGSQNFETGEIKTPASVTEGTTKLLKKEED